MSQEPGEGVRELRAVGGLGGGGLETECADCGEGNGETFPGDSMAVCIPSTTPVCTSADMPDPIPLNAGWSARSGGGPIGAGVAHWRRAPIVSLAFAFALAFSTKRPGDDRPGGDRRQSVMSSFGGGGGDIGAAVGFDIEVSAASAVRGTGTYPLSFRGSGGDRGPANPVEFHLSYTS